MSGDIRVSLFPIYAFVTYTGTTLHVLKLLYVPQHTHFRYVRIPVLRNLFEKVLEGRDADIKERRIAF